MSRMKKRVEHVCAGHEIIELGDTCGFFCFNPQKEFVNG